MSVAEKLPDGTTPPPRPRVLMRKICAPSISRVVFLSISSEWPFQFQPRLPWELSMRTLTSIFGCPQNPGWVGGPSMIPGVNALPLYFPFSQKISILDWTARLSRR